MSDDMTRTEGGAGQPWRVWRTAPSPGGAVLAHRARHCEPAQPSQGAQPVAARRMANSGGIGAKCNRVAHRPRDAALVRNAEIEHFRSVPHTPGAPLVSVVIPCVNHGAFVAEAVDSALAQTFSDLEVIVVEGGSTDGTTPDAVAALASPRVKVFFREGGPFPLGDNRNFGIARGTRRLHLLPRRRRPIDADVCRKDALFPGVSGLRCRIEHHATVRGTDRDMGASRNADFVRLDGPETDMLAGAVFRKDVWQGVAGYVDAGLGVK